LNGIIQNQDIIKFFKGCIKTKNVPHLLLHGAPGTGKTSAILALGKELFGDFYRERIFEFNASDDRGINTVRTKISAIAKRTITNIDPNIPNYKIIILDEADSMTNDAQDALRVIIEEYCESTRFCFICNYASKITGAIKSRCTNIHFKRLSTDMIINKLKSIAQAEDITNITENIYDVITKLSAGDMRKAIMILHNMKYVNTLQQISTKKISEVNSNILEAVVYAQPIINREIILTEDIVYKHMCTLSPTESNNLLKLIINAKKIMDLVKICDGLFSRGNSADNIMTQLQKCVIQYEMNSDHKAKILTLFPKYLFICKTSNNDYVHLLALITKIYEIINK
jgi:replication factor C subunit 2/4